MEITAEHVKELWSLFGENVLVQQPGVHGLWVIETGNQHYQGAHTVYATSRQVEALVGDADTDADGELTDKAAEWLAARLQKDGREQARESAQGMPNPQGRTVWVPDGTVEL